MIDAGLPSERAGWPHGVLEALRQFRQGDVVEAPPIFYFADPGAPTWAATGEAGLDGPDVVVLDGLCPYALLTTQTCDIAEEDSARPARPFVQVAPVYDATNLIDGSMRSLLARGRGFMYVVHLPAIADGFWVADLRLEIPVEKGWLAGRARVLGFSDEAGRELLGQRLVRIKERPALAGRFVETVHRPLVDAITHLRHQDRTQFTRLLANVDQVRVAVDSRLNPTVAQLYVLNDIPIPGDIEEWFRGWWDGVNPGAVAVGIRLLGLRTLTYGELTAEEYRASAELDLVRVSPT